MSNSVSSLLMLGLKILQIEWVDLINTIGINSPANGMLLQGDFAKAYDEGKFAIRLNANSQYEVVAISFDYLHELRWICSL
jgi:hypothetical protein